MEELPSSADIKTAQHSERLMQGHEMLFSSKQKEEYGQARLKSQDPASPLKPR